MALPSSKSASAANSAVANPHPTRPLNPNPRASEVTNPTRRSFSGNPFTRPSIVADPRGFNPATPANSPSEMPRRRESLSCLREPEEKENGKDPNSKTRQTRVIRSPGISKGTKNFMSPTISAASKFSASPRKKILTERNVDVLHSSSTSLTDLRSSCGSVNIPENSEETEAKMIVEDSHEDDSSLGSKGSRKKVSFDSVVQEIPPTETTDVETEADLVNIDEEFLNQKSPSSTSSLLAPLDADPLVPLPPYDPNTNYLSPRPQFLHYRPSQRLKHYVGVEEILSFDPLEDGSDLEGPSDTELTTDEISPSEKESDDVSSDEAAKQVVMGSESKSDDDIKMAEEPEVEEAAKQVKGSESKSDDDLKMTEEPEVEEDVSVQMEGPVGAQEHSKRSSFFARSMLFMSIFVFIATSSAMVGTHYFPSGGDLTMKGPSLLLEAQRLKDSAAENMKLWYANSLCYLSSLVLDFRGDQHVWEGVQYYNLTDLNEKSWLDNDGIFGSPIKVDGFVNHETGSGEDGDVEYSETEKDVDAADEGDEVPEVDEPEEEEEAVAANETYRGNEIMDLSIQDVAADEGSQHSENDQANGGDEIMDPSLNIESVNEPETLLHADMEEVSITEVKLEMEFTVENQEAIVRVAETECIEQGLLKVQFEVDQPADPGVEDTNQPQVPMAEVENGVHDGHVEEEEEGSIILEDPDHQHTPAFTVNSESSQIVNSSGILLPLLGVIFALVAAVACLVARTKKTSSGGGVIGQGKIQVQEPLVAKKFNINPVTASHVTEYDVIGNDSCPSEMTSFQKNAAGAAPSCSKGMMKNVSRRESTASSSFSDFSSSPSYGSFTTYEIIPNKNREGDKEDSVITPIRRSSRLLRKQHAVTS
ncbi:hypothetical protein SAY86_024414 [Trapa natans]|uniref:Uncharacterized protein n=1 Tax=Trapa natans TaxID=22666 RepID=A0AAN7M6N4_TRANT|nr:hypothetical protein SAY86_024414 [Trapa natans]